MPQAAVAANIASAETDCHTAAGPSTRNGAARRAAPSAPSTRAVTSTATAVVAASSVTTIPAAEAAAEPDPVERHEERQRPGRVAGDVHRPVAGPASTRIRLTYSCRVACRSVVTRGRCGGTRTAHPGSARRRASRPRTRAPASTPGRPGTTHEQQPSPRQRLRERRGVPHAKHRERAGRAPCPSRPGGATARAAAGSEFTWTNHPVTAGTAIASTISATAVASPHAAGDVRRVAARAEVMSRA